MAKTYTWLGWDEKAERFVPRLEPYEFPDPLPLEKVREPLPQWRPGTEAFRRRQEIMGEL